MDYQTQSYLALARASQGNLDVAARRILALFALKRANSTDLSKQELELMDAVEFELKNGLAPLPSSARRLGSVADDAYAGTANAIEDYRRKS